MYFLPKTVNRLIDQFSTLPGIGKKTAQRLAFYILKSNKERIFHLSESIKEVKNRIIFCSICHGITETDPCIICVNVKRNNSIICIVEDAKDIFTFEKTNSFEGKYHVLGGVLSPLDGVGPDDLNIKSLLNRIKSGMEVIIATNSSIEGETTSLYLSKILSNFSDLKITRLARGLPVGGDIEHIDEATLIRAMEERILI